MDKRLNVVHMVPLGAGGITTMVLNIAQELQNSDIQINYLTFLDRKEFNEDRALSYGGKKLMVPTDHYSNQFLRAVYKFFKTISVLKENKADIVHINASFPYDIMVGVSAKLAGAKVVFHSHNSSMRKDTSIRSKLMPLFKVLIPLVSDCNYTCSELAAQFMFTDGILKAKNYHVFHNSIVSEKYRFNRSVREQIREELQLKDKLVIGHIGRFTRQKNHKFLLDIFAEIRSRRPEAVLLLLGVGELMEQTKEYAKHHGLSDSVIFYGATQRVPEFLQAMDCFLLPSLYEGLPFSAIEAQAAGLPSFFSDTVSSEAGVTERAFYLPLSGKASDWAEKILTEIHDRDDHGRCVQQIRESGYELSENVSQLCDRYRELVKT